MSETITLGGREFALPVATIPFLVELATLLDAEEPGLAGAVKRNAAILALALRDTDYDPARHPTSFEELGDAMTKIMRSAGFQWGEVPPADAGSPNSLTI